MESIEIFSLKAPVIGDVGNEPGQIGFGNTIFGRLPQRLGHVSFPSQRRLYKPGPARLVKTARSRPTRSARGMI
jgi:hypothetical protein